MMSDALGKFAVLVGAVALAWQHVLRDWAVAQSWGSTTEFATLVHDGIHGAFWGLFAHALVSWSSIDNRYAEVVAMVVAVLYFVHPSWWWWPL